MPEDFRVQPIAYVRKEEKEEEEQLTYIEVLPKYQAGLLNMELFSHCIVLWWISKRDTKGDRKILQARPMLFGKDELETPLSGIFTTRAPMRPNPIGLTIVKVLEVKDNKLFIDKIDAFDNTPILDLKPYILSSDCIPSATVPDYMVPLANPREK